MQNFTNKYLEALVHSELARLYRASLCFLIFTAALGLAHCSSNGGGNGNGGGPNPLCAEDAKSTGFNDGNGTETAPYLICARDQLEKIKDELSQHYVLGQDIDLEDSEFTPIAGVFKGSLDGLGYSIQNLMIRVSSNKAGLFAELGSSGKLRNLSIAGVDVQSTFLGAPINYALIGTLVALSKGEIRNCSVTDSDGDAVHLQNTNSLSIDRVGGLVGWQEGGSIIASRAAVNLDGGDISYEDVGGLVGQQNGGSIIASYAAGNADGGDGNEDHVGGLVGQQVEGSIIASYAAGNADGGGWW